MNNLIEKFIRLYNVNSKEYLSGLSDEDIIAIEDGTGYEFPEEYKSFLQNYNLPSQKFWYVFVDIAMPDHLKNTTKKLVAGFRLVICI